MAANTQTFGSHPFEKKLQEQQRQHFRNILVYGPSGVGKTSLVGSAAFDPRTSPIIVLDFDGGSISLEGIDPSLLMYRRLSTWEEYEEAYDYLANHKHPFKCVAIDSISETHVFSMLNIIDKEIEESVEKARKEGKKPEDAKRNDELEVQQQDYGKSMVQIRRFMRSWLKLPMHSIFTALPKSAKVPREGTVMLPAMFGQMAEEIVGMFDMSAYLNFETIEVPADPNKKGSKATTRQGRVLSLQNTSGVRVKTRTPFGQSKSIPNRMEIGENNGITKILDILKVPK